MWRRGFELALAATSLEGIGRYLYNHRISNPSVDKGPGHVFRLTAENMPTATVTLGDEMTDGSGSELTWHRGARCESGACVEVATNDNVIFVRSSVHPEATPVILSRDEWNEFVSEVKDGAFDLI